VRTLFLSTVGFGLGLYHFDLMREYLRRNPGREVSFHAKSKFLRGAAREISFISEVLSEPTDGKADETVEFKPGPAGLPIGKGIARATFGWDYPAKPYVEFKANKKRWDRYRKKLDLPSSYAVVNPFASPDREWPAVRWKELVERITFKAVVFEPLESAQEETDFGDAIVLSGLSFLQICEILSRARFYIGSESGLTLLAHLLNPRLLQLVRAQPGPLSLSLTDLGCPSEQIFPVSDFLSQKVEPVAEKVSDLLGSHRVTDIPQEAKPPKVSIIIPIKDNLEITHQCLTHLNRFTPKELYEVILIDNGCTDENRAKLAQIQGVTLMRNEKNLGFSKAVNQGMRTAKGKYFCLLNNDVLVYPGWLEGMILAAEADPTIGIVGPLTNFAAGAQRTPFQGQPADMAARVRIQHAGAWATVPFVTFFCTLIKRELTEKIAEQDWPDRGCDDGLLPEIYFAGAEDLHYCAEAQLVGYLAVIAQSVWVYHIGHQTFRAEGFESKGEGEAYTKYWEKQTGQEVKCLLDAYRHLGLLDTRNELAVCAMVKDEADQIMEFCENIRGLGDEIIIGDTGSTDGTYEYLEKWFEGDGFWRPRGKLLRLEWEDDFAKAHNQIAAEATADWIFFLDADERFDSSQIPKLRASLDQDDVDAWRPTLVSFNDDPFETENPDVGILRHIRLYRNHREITWRFRVDEVVDYSVWENNLVDQVAPLEIHHYGALDSEKGVDREDYARLWGMVVEEEPTAYQHWFQLGLFCEKDERDLDRALLCFENAVKYFDPIHDRPEKLAAYQQKLQEMMVRMGKIQPPSPASTQGPKEEADNVLSFASK